MEQQEKETYLTIEEANELVVENQKWAESIAKSVAHAWNLDWKIDGLDGAALEALIFCSRRFNPKLGIPFKAYARKRIHEASVEVARKSKGWAISRKKDPLEHKAKEISNELLKQYPELKDGMLPIYVEDKDGEVSQEEEQKATKLFLREMLLGADIIATKQEMMQESSDPDDIYEAKRMVLEMARLDVVHQKLLWGIYWEGLSLRSLADEWETDELNVIREHKVLLDWLSKCMKQAKKILPPKIRPGLRKIALDMKKGNVQGDFSKLIEDFKDK